MNKNTENKPRQGQTLWKIIKGFVCANINNIAKVITTLALWAAAFVILLEIWRGIQNVFATLPSNLFVSLLNSTNITRLGLIFQLVGLIAVLPEISKRVKVEKWERWLHSTSESSQGIQFTFSDLFRISPWFWLQTRGGIGLVNMLSRGVTVIYTLFTVIPIFWNRIQSGDLIVSAGLILIILMIDILWIYMTWMVITSALQNKNLSFDFMFLYSFLNFGLIVSVFFFVPVAILVIVVIRQLQGIARNPLETILTKATFPFVLIGTVMELVATFL